MCKLAQLSMHNRGKISLTCIASKPRKPIPEFARTVCTHPTLSKRFLRRPKCKRIFPVFKTKNTRRFFKLKKNMAKIVFRGCHWRHTLRKRVETISTRAGNNPKKFPRLNYALGRTSEIFSKKISADHENFGLMFYRFWGNISIW